MKLKLIIALMLMVPSLGAFGEDDPYKDGKYKDLLLEVYKQISLFYPDKTLCVSYEVIVPFFSAGAAIDKGAQQLVEQQYARLLYRAFQDKSVVSEKLKAYFPDCDCETQTADYRMQFSIPTKGMIICDVYPYDMKMGIYGGASGYQCFLIRFNDKDGIYQISKSELIVD